MSTESINVIEKVYSGSTYIGYIFPMQLEENSSNIEYLISMRDNFAHPDKETAIKQLHKEAVEDKEHVEQLNHVFGLRPAVCLSGIPEDKVVLQPSMRWGSIATTVSFLHIEDTDEGVTERKRFYGMVYELPNGKFVNQHRPYEFDTKMQAAQDLLSICAPVQFRLVDVDGNVLHTI